MPNTFYEFEPSFVKEPAWKPNSKMVQPHKMKTRNTTLRTHKEVDVETHQEGLVTIFIRTDEWTYRPASDLDLKNRGYVSTLDLPDTSDMEKDILGDVLEVRFTLIDGAKKIKAIKAFRDAVVEFRKDHPLLEQRDGTHPNDIGGLKYAKQLVEGGRNITCNRVFYDLMIQFQETRGLHLDKEYNLTIVYSSTNSNLERLLAHKEKLKEMSDALEALLSQHLYS